MGKITKLTINNQTDVHLISHISEIEDIIRLEEEKREPKGGNHARRGYMYIVTYEKDSCNVDIVKIIDYDHLI